MQVYLLKPGGAAQEHFEKLVNLLEQFVFENLLLKIPTYRLYMYFFESHVITIYFLLLIFQILPSL